MFLKSLLALLGLVVVARGQVGITAFLNQMTALKYNNQCSWTNEVSRQNLAKSMVNNPLSSSSLMNSILTFQSDVVRNNKKFCSAPELLICDKDSQRCVCGDPGKEAALPGNGTSGFVLEDDNGTSRCRWAEGSSCLSDDILRAQGFGDFLNSKCQLGTSCISKASGGGPCSFSTLVNYILSNYRYSAARRQGQIMKDVFNGKVCTCQPNVSTNTIGSEESDEDWGRRKKRSVAPYHYQQESQVLASFGAPVAYVQDMLV